MAATGKVGIAAAAATGSITAGALMGWVEKLNLQRVLGASEAAFRDQRSLEIADHLQILCNQTFEAPTDRLKRLAKLQEEAEPAGRSVLACLDRIKTISSPRENQSGEQQTREQQS
jgi:hypothetical protein